MADIDAYKDKFSESGRRILETALNESKKRDQHYVSIEHILHAIANEESELFNATMRDLSSPQVGQLLIGKKNWNAAASILAKATVLLRNYRAF